MRDNATNSGIYTKIHSNYIIFLILKIVFNALILEIDTSEADDDSEVFFIKFIG